MGIEDLYLGINKHIFSSTIQLKRDMNTAIEGCNSLTRSGQDLPTKLKIASISTRFNNLKHDGDKLLVIFVTKPIDATSQRRNSKAKSKRSDSASASELAIKQTLANLQSTFASYKKAFERRLVSHRTGGQVAATSESPRQPDGSGMKTDAVRLKTKSEVKPSVLIEASPSHTRNVAGENHVRLRPRTHTADHRPDNQNDKDNKSPSHNVVKDKVASFNKRAQEEEQIQMPNFGITFDIRPRARTADPTVGREGKSGVSPRHRGNAKAVPEKPEQERETKVEESPVDVTSVPLRRNRGRGRGHGGLSKDERRQKIAAIRELFETSDLSNIVSEPGKQWKPAHLAEHSPAKRMSTESIRKTSEGSSSVVTQSSSLESGSGTSLSESGQPAFMSSTSSMDNEKPTTSVDQQLPATVKASENKAEESEEKLATSCQTDSTAYNDATSTAREQAASPSVLVSPPPETRTRLHTAPAVYRTVVKDLSGMKQQVRTLSVEHTPTPVVTQALPKAEPTHPSREAVKLSPDIPIFKGGSLERNVVPGASNFTRDTRATRSMSPQHRRRMVKENSQPQQSSSPGRTRRPPFLQVAGKVSSLRSMFDAQAQAQTNSATLGPFMRKRASSESKPYQVKPTQPLKLKAAEKSIHQRSSSMDTTHVKKAPPPVPSVVHQRSSSMDTTPSKKLPTPVQEEEPPPPPPRAQAKRAKSPDIIPIMRPEPLRPDPPKESPLTTSITESSSPHPPPRPPSPVGYILEKEGESGSELESESEGSIYESDTSSLDEVDLEWVGGEDEVDLPWGLDDPDMSLAEQKMFKSLR